MVTNSVRGYSLNVERTERFAATLLFVGLFVAANPYYFWGMWTPKLLAFVAFCGCIFLSLLRGVSKQTIVLSFVLLSVYLYWSLPGEKGLFVIPVLNMAGIVCILLLQRDKVPTVVDGFFRVLAYLLLPGLFIYVLLFLNIEVPYKMYVHSGNVEDNLYRVYPGAVLLDHLIYPLPNFTISRFQGVLDEPGYLGTIVILYLAGVRFDMRPRYRKILFIAALLTLSLAFLFLFLLFLLLSFFRDRRSFIWSFIAVAVGIAVFMNLEQTADLPLISRVVQAIETGSLDSRASVGFDKEFSMYIEGDWKTLLFGFGNAAHTTLGVNMSSGKSLLYNYGIVGMLMVLVFFAAVYASVFSAMPAQALAASLPFIVVFFASAYQRPDILTPVYFSIFYSSLIREQDLLKANWLPSRDRLPRSY